MSRRRHPSGPPPQVMRTQPSPLAKGLKQARAKVEELQAKSAFLTQVVCALLMKLDPPDPADDNPRPCLLLTPEDIDAALDFCGCRTGIKRSAREDGEGINLEVFLSALTDDEREALTKNAAVDRAKAKGIILP